MKYRVTHKTCYTYQEAVSFCHNEAHLIPRASLHQNCFNKTLVIQPEPTLQTHREDFFGNIATYFSIEIPHKELTVTATSEIEILHPGTIDLPTHSLPWENVRDQLTDINNPKLLEVKEYLLESPFIPITSKLHNYAKPSFTPGRPILEATLDLMKRIDLEFTYDPHFTTIVTPIEEVLEHRRGVCQDFAHLMIACLRTMGLAARYVSGYLETLPPPGQIKLQGSDASHAWLSVYSPDQGWIDFDPTNYQIPTIQHITTAWGRDYSDVTPLKGIIFGGGGHTLTVSVDVAQLP